MSATSKPYAVSNETPAGPLGGMYEVTGPGNYRSSHGGGRDNGKAAAHIKACELNSAFQQGQLAANASLLKVCELLVGWPMGNEVTLDQVKAMASAAIEDVRGKPLPTPKVPSRSSNLTYLRQRRGGR